MKIPSRGFTFIEIIIYVAVLAVFSVLVVNIILVLTESFGRFKATNRIISSAEAALERITREIRLAGDLDGSKSIFNVSPGRLSLKTINPLNGASTTSEFFLATTTLMLQESLNEPQPLTTSQIKVTNLVFRQINNSSVSKAVRIEIEFQSGADNLKKSEKFYQTAILRRSYQ